MADRHRASAAPVHPTLDGKHETLRFTSRRSPVLCRNGCVASSQPLASSIGVDFLRQGANAADAAVAVAAVLAVTEPCSTGLGGDMFSLYYDAKERRVSAINGSGKSPSALTRDMLVEQYPDGQGGIDGAMFGFSPHSVTVPGAAQGWEDCLNRHGSGKFTLAQLLEPAAVLAEEGFPVAPVTAHHWKEGFQWIEKWLEDGEEPPLSVEGDKGIRRAPESGDVVINENMARVLRELGRLGARKGFYQARTGQAIVEATHRLGGCLAQVDLDRHSSTFPEPIFATYRDWKVWQVPPNGQGIAGLIALMGLQHLEEKRCIAPIGPAAIGSEEVYHAMIEMMRLGFADTTAHAADPDYMTVSNQWLLDLDRIGQRAEKLFQPGLATIHGVPDASSCTVSFQVVDSEGNAISFVNSNYMGFGTGIVPRGCGFSLQNRGFGFSLKQGHVNQVGPSKRPFHTIIPCIITHADTDDLYATISNMGGNMQPQGHLQLTVNMLAGRVDPQTAIDQPRFCITDGTQGGSVHMESGVDDRVVKTLKKRGHLLVPNVTGWERSIFGRAQVIKRDRKTGVLWAGSDGRADGCAVGY